MKNLLDSSGEISYNGFNKFFRERRRNERSTEEPYQRD